MQIIESTAFGVRSALFRMKSTGARCTYTIIPMIHVARPTFYDEVVKELRQHDLILFEGVRHRTANYLTRLYGYLANSPAIDLVVQPSLRRIIADDEKCIHIDMPAEVFDAAWDDLTLLKKVLFYLEMTLSFFFVRFFGSRDLFAKAVAMDYRKSVSEIMAVPDRPGVDELIVDARDQYIVDRLRHIHSEIRNDKKSVVIVFGAAHMRAIIHYLVGEEEFHIYDSRWLSVFE